MSKTSFGKKLLGLLLALVLVVSLVSCGDTLDPKKPALEEATELAEQIKAQLIWDSSAMVNLTSNLKGFITKTKFSNVTVAWSSDQPDVISADGKVSRPNYDDSRAVESEPAVMDGETVVEEAKKVIWVNVTATITAKATWTADGEEKTEDVKVEKVFKFSVQTLPSNLFMGTIAECKAAAAEYIYVENKVQKELVSNSSVVYNVGMYGVVTAVLEADGAGQFMIHDGTAGIYVYNNSVDVKPGDQVLVYGEIYSYYGNLQVGSNITVSVLTDGTAVAGEYREVYPQAIEDEGAAKDENGLVKAGYFGGELLSLSGKLVKGAAAQGSGMYHIADPFTGEQVWIYYKSYNPEMQANLDLFVDKYVKIRGVSYDRDSRIVKCEILWDGTIEEIEAPTLSDEQKVAVALASITVPAEATTNFDLSAEGAWEVVSGTAIVVENGVAKVTRGEADDTVTLKVTVTIGTASDSKEFEVKVPAASMNILTVAEVLALCPTDGATVTEEKYYVRGTITEVQNTTYGNFVIADTTGSITVYGSYSADGKVRYDKLEVKPVVGDVVTVYGALTSYVKGENVTKEVKNGWIQEHFVTKTYAEAVTLAGTTKDVYTEAKYLLGGTVVSIENAKYGNLTIADAEGTKFTVYGSYSEDGKVRYDALEYKPAVGDYVYCYGILGYYNAPQMKNAQLVNISNLVSIPAALELCGTDGSYTDAAYLVKGTIKAIASEKYGNMTLVDAAGNEIATYGLYSADGKVRYDAMENKPVVGDTIIVRGTLGAYVKDTTVSKQIKNAQFICVATPDAAEKTDAEKVADALAELKVPAELLQDYTLATTATWEVLSGTAIALENGVAKVTRGAEEATVVLKATVTIGEASDSKEFTVKVPAEGMTLTSIPAAVELCGTTKDVYTEVKYYVKGVVSSTPNATYGNLTIKDEAGNSLYIYGLYSADGSVRYDKLEVKPVEGDTVVLYGILGYYTSAQMKNAQLVEHTPAPEKSDAEKVEADKALLEVAETQTANFKVAVVGKYGSTISWASDNAAIAINGEIATVVQGDAEVTVKLTATLTSGAVVDTKEFTIKVPVKAAEDEKAVKYDFVTGFATYAASWSSSYTELTVASAELGSGLKDATFVFSNANKQSTTITDRPVGASKGSAQYLTVTTTNSVTAVEFEISQWTTKVFTDIHIEYYNGTEWVSASDVITTPAKIATNVTLPEGVTQVRLSFYATGTKNVQIGFGACTITY